MNKKGVVVETDGSDKVKVYKVVGVNNYPDGKGVDYINLLDKELKRQTVYVPNGYPKIVIGGYFVIYKTDQNSSASILENTCLNPRVPGTNWQMLLKSDLITKAWKSLTKDSIIKFIVIGLVIVAIAVIVMMILRQNSGAEVTWQMKKVIETGLL